MTIWAGVNTLDPNAGRTERTSVEGASTSGRKFGVSVYAADSSTTPRATALEAATFVTTCGETGCPGVVWTSPVTPA